MKRLLQAPALSILFLAVIQNTAYGQVAAGLDQYQLQCDVSFAIHSVNPNGQWFTVGADGLLSAVELSLGIDGSPSEDLIVEVFNFSAGSLGAFLGSTSISASDLGPMQLALDVNEITATLVPLEDLGITVSSGETIAFWFTTAAVLPDLYSIRIDRTDNYPNGEFISAGGPTPLYDHMFKTFVARPVFADGFESGTTSAWTSTVGVP